MWYKGLRELRKAVNMSVKELAEQIGKSPSYISRLESGSIHNTSYENVLMMAKVIAKTDAIVNGDVNLDEYDSDFAKLVFGCCYKKLKNVYDFSMENKEARKYAETLPYLQEGDWDMLRALSAYRLAEAEFELSKAFLKRNILASTETQSIEEAQKKIYSQGCAIRDMEVRIPLDLVLNGKCEEVMNAVSDWIEYEAGLIGVDGITKGTFIYEDYYTGSIGENDSDDNVEWEINIPGTMRIVQKEQ